ncbi:LysR substrate-binding domain-containing protein [Pseudomonas aeruginosa]|nr:LysR substrate-binding domain-containing protein [Pseudomonas aeruginosa]
MDSLITIARWVIAPRLHDFQARYPRIQLRLSSSDRISNLLEDGIDCTIRGGALKDSSMIARHLLRHPDGLVCLARVPGLHRRCRQSERSIAVQAVELVQRQGAQPVHVGAGVRPGAFRGAVRRWNAVRRTRRGYFGLHGGQRHLPWRPIRGGWIRTRRKLVPVLPQWHFSAAPVHVIYPGSRHLSVRVRCFVNWVMELFAENPEIQLTPIALALESGLAQRT